MKFNMREGVTAKLLDFIQMQMQSQNLPRETQDYMAPFVDRLGRVYHKKLVKHTASFYRVIVNRDEAYALDMIPGFSPVCVYAYTPPLKGEIGSYKYLRFFWEKP